MSSETIVERLLKGVSKVQVVFMCKFHFDALVKKKKHGLDLL